MRIRQVVSSLGAGGAEVFATDLSLALAARGHDVGVIAFSDAADLGDESGLDARNRARLEAAGIPVEIIGHRARRRLLPAAWRLRALLDRADPDLVHCHLKIGLMSLLLWRGPVVATHHTTPLHRPYWLMKLLARRARAYIAISREARSNLAPFLPCPVTLIPNGVNATRLDPGDVSDPEKPRDGLTVLSLGNLRVAKNYPLLVEIAARSDPRLSFLIAGEGEQRPAIEARIRDLGIGDRVTLLGARSDPAALLARADIYLMTSDWEGMPISLIEALHAGLPVIASNVGGCPDILGAEGDCAFLPAPGEPDPFIAALDKLASDPGLRARMGRAARERAKLFSIEAAAEAHEALYRQVLG